MVGYEPDFPDPEAANLAAVVLPDGTMGAQPYAKVHPVLLEGGALHRRRAVPHPCHPRSASWAW